MARTTQRAKATTNLTTAKSMRWIWVLSVITTMCICTTAAWAEPPQTFQKKIIKQLSSDNRQTAKHLRLQGPAPLLVTPPSEAPRLGFMGHMEHGWGMMVDNVYFGTTAQQIGLETGDVILKVNGHRVTCSQRWNALMWDAVQHHGGRIILRVDNVRARRGYPVPRYATVSGWLDHVSIYHSTPHYALRSGGQGQ